MLLVLLAAMQSDLWCEGYRLTREPDRVTGFYVAYTRDGRRGSWREIPGQGYQIFAGDGPQMVHPGLCIEIRTRTDER